MNLQRRLIGAGRGDLYLGVRGQERVSLIRLLDGNLTDSDFRRRVEEVRAAIGQMPPAPRVLSIVEQEFLGDHYYIQYALGGRLTISVPELFAREHWLRRLRFVEGIASVYGEWRKRVPLPAGLHAGSVVACKVGGQWVAHLAPCPTLHLRSPLDLRDAESEVLAALAPESLRGIPALGAVEDVYSAGALVLQALGVRPFDAGLNKEACIEAQARARFTEWDFEASQIEAALWRIPAARDLLGGLKAAVQRGAVFAPEGRPRDLGELHQAILRVLALEDAAGFAERLKMDSRLADALAVLEWYLSGPLRSLVADALVSAEERRIHALAAQWLREMKMPARELYHIEKLLLLSKGETAWERRRLDLRCEFYFQKTQRGQVADSEREADWLLAEIERLRQHLPEDYPDAKEDRLRAATIRWRRGDLYGRANELYRLTMLDENDLDALYLYGLAFHDLCSQPGLEKEQLDVLAARMEQLVCGAARRAGSMEEAGFIPVEEATTWLERLQSLLDENDFEALYRFGLVYRDLCFRPRPEREQPDALTAGLNRFARDAVRRVRKMKEAGLLSDEEMTTWIERFQSLPRP